VAVILGYLSRAMSLKTRLEKLEQTRGKPVLRVILLKDGDSKEAIRQKHPRDTLIFCSELDERI
jgi:hypothetical protein